MKNSAHFVQLIKDTTIESKDHMVSFDVESLFAKVPIDKAMDVTAAKLNDDDTRDDRMMMSTEEICRLTKLCLNSTYFQFKSIFYVQVEGVAMDSFSFPVVVNLFMEAFEETVL